jgi:hypothetical protein
MCLLAEHTCLLANSSMSAESIFVKYDTAELCQSVLTQSDFVQNGAVIEI